MTRAAAEGHLFHLWWHPHNFGVDLRENLDVLSALLRHFSELQERYGMQSLSMADVAMAVRRPPAT
jgi:hypothetical protein